MSISLFFKTQTEVATKRALALDGSNMGGLSLKKFIHEDSNIFAFWTKSSIDVDSRNVRLKSNRYTTTNILDMVVAANIQFKEMDGVTIFEQPGEKKKVFPDWKNLMKPGNEEKDHWSHWISFMDLGRQFLNTNETVFHECL
ncbi:hypothetical protein L2E82_11802 [Cichorium intybus]|uniref:Uncharacterized protein n=1 Tax=Cichorium intybus TaxID=13427 RepID=A0ACB9GE70_CICIN|nr:hypothetical protein L2E82_11802 [Cichorium intybus]